LNFKETIMKKVILLIMCLALLAATIVPVASGQDRSRRSRFGRKARTAAIIGGGTAAGAIIGGGKGAAIGAGAGTVYAVNRRAARNNFSQRKRRAATVAGGTVAGAGLGAAVGGGKGAAIGAAAGAGSSYLYTKRSRHYTRRRY
jgi:hypothetical protein